ncbi:MAG: hypothetical protein KTQ49_02755 [Candidatus Omnitrophica bacterium]|nr:hypothetical protein [Candidatus Omnitrophota bacterium]
MEVGFLRPPPLSTRIGGFNYGQQRDHRFGHRGHRGRAFGEAFFFKKRKGLLPDGVLESEGRERKNGHKQGIKDKIGAVAPHPLLIFDPAGIA